ncbi:uncharacterized protein BDW70DRAFT_157997 [Aspergillus foveolatus]|uniref:uncharacterized protein n=1 Tax=Aspergillus foveolatus TaxID=210207 RepID=UPI003CCDE37E
MAILNSRPPPSYTATIATQDINPYDDDKYDDNDHHSHGNTTGYYKNTPTTPSFPVSSTASTRGAVVISLDSSINIRGDGNTVAIASGQGKNQAQAQTQTQQEASNPKSKVANTTASIIAALQQSGILALRPDSGSNSASTTVQININAGIKVQGLQNVVCFGSLTVPTTSVSGSRTNVNLKHCNTRKRRAQSVPANNEPEWKKYRKC